MDFAPPLLAETLANARGVIFDIDGVLLDSLASGEKLFCKTAKKFGLTADSTVLQKFHQHRGTTACELIKLCFSEQEIDITEFYDQWKQYDKEILHPLLPGVITVLPALLAKEKILSLCSNREEFTARGQLTSHGIMHYFSYTSFLADTAFPKPHPQSINDLLVQYLGRQGINTKQLLYCGDSLDSDLPVACAHDISFVAVLGGKHTRADFLAAGVPNTHIVENLGEFLPYLKP